jgi:ribonuclease HII
MTNFAHGREAEAAAAEYLEGLGYKIRVQNWRTRQCEIDIVAEKDKTIYCVEVKYRQNTAQGSGLDYITPKKLQQMYFAAEVWAAKNHWQNDICLAAIEVAGDDYHIETFIDDII